MLRFQLQSSYSMSSLPTRPHVRTSSNIHDRRIRTLYLIRKVPKVNNIKCKIFSYETQNILLNTYFGHFYVHINDSVCVFVMQTKHFSIYLHNQFNSKSGNQCARVASPRLARRALCTYVHVSYVCPFSIYFCTTESIYNTAKYLYK